MGKSLQEQLLQSGAVKPKQARKARREKAISEKAARKSGSTPAEQAALEKQVAQAELQKRERDRQLNAQQKAQREARELAHSVAQILARNKVDPCGDDDQASAYSYTIDKQIHRISVSADQRADIAAGRLAVVRNQDMAFLVPRRVAERLMEKVPEQVWLVSSDAAEGAADDPYAEYKVPDDLVW